MTTGKRRREPFRAVALTWLLACTAALVVCRPAWAEMRALIVGIDRYHAIRPLAGAVNDARDIAAVLAGLGVQDLTLLLDDAAGRDRITEAFASLMARAARGDILIFTYAGHGSQEPEHVPGSEADGQDEVLVLGGFAERGQGSRERIIDDELNQWFREAGRRGLAVVFVADACHSGTLTRGIDPRARAGRVRYSAYAIEEDLLELATPPDAARLDQDDLPHVTFLAAGQEDQTIPEVILPNAPAHPNERVERGALSWVFARALEGGADHDGDGRLTRRELNAFVRENVRVWAEGRQTPNLLPQGDDDHVVLRLAKASQADRVDSPAAAGRAVRLAITGLAGADAAVIAAGLTHLTLVGATEAADLIYDAKTRQVISRQGDILVYDLDPAGLQGPLDKWGALEALKRAGMDKRLRMRVLPDDATKHAGQEIGFQVDDIALPYLVIFSLSGDGTVHFHYPVAGDPPGVAAGRPVRYDFRVEPPFGADHIVTVTSGAPMEGLTATLRGIDGRRAAREAAAAVLRATSSGDHQIGIQGLYTAPW